MFGKKARKIEELERTVECLKSALNSLEEDYIALREEAFATAKVSKKATRKTSTKKETTKKATRKNTKK